MSSGIRTEDEEEANKIGISILSKSASNNSCTPYQNKDDIESQNQSQLAVDVIPTTQINNNNSNNPFFSAFKGCSKWLLIIVLVSSALLAVGSSCLPILLMERFINAVEHSSSSDIHHDFVTNTLFCYAAFGALFIFFWIRYWTVIGEAQSARMRDQLYQKATLKQGESFDRKVNIRTIEDLERNFRYMTLIRDATGVKAGIFIFLMCNFIISYIIALTRAPLLTLSVFIPCVILLAIFHYIKVVIKSRMDSQEQEAIPSIKTDSTLSMLQKLCKYVETEAVLEGGINGLCELILVSCAELQLWLGNKMGYSSTEATVTIQCTIIGLKSLCLALPYWSTIFSEGRDAANKMSEIIKSEQLREDQGQIDEQGSQSPINRKSSGIGSSTTSLNSDYASSDVSSRFSEPESTPSPPPPPTESKSLHNDIPKRSLRWRAYDLNIQELYYTITGMILSVAIGAITPVFNLMLASKILDFYTPDQNQQLWKFLCLLGVPSLFIHPLRTHCFKKSGLELTNRTRSMISKKVATLKINGFQIADVTVASLYTDAALMKVLVGDDLSFHSQNVGSALASCVITGILNWKLALAIFIFYIVLGVIWILQCKCMFKLRTHAKNELFKAKEVGSIHLDSMNDEEKVMEEHRSKCEGLETIGRRDVLISSVGCGLIVFIFFTMLAIIFRHAVVGHIKEEKSQAPRILFSLFLGVAMVMVGLVVSASYPFDITKAEAAAGSVFAFLDGDSENELVR